MNIEREMNNMANIMTKQTQERLQKELVVAKEKHISANLDIGDAAGESYDWHDNAAFDSAQIEAGMAATRVRSLTEKLEDVQIINPREETKDVQVGNTVVVRFETEDSDETFTLLGPDDSQTGRDKGWISNKTPLGKAIIGSKEGDIVELKLSEDRIQRVTIKEIRKGEF